MNVAKPKLAERLAGCAVLPPMTDERRQCQEQPAFDARRLPDECAGKLTQAKEKTKRRSTRDRFETLNAFVDFTAGTVTRSELLVWLTLYRDTRNGIAKTGQADVARRTGVCRRSVCLAIRNLERRGLLVVARRGGLNRGPSTYRVEPLERKRQRVQPIAP